MYNDEVVNVYQQVGRYPAGEAFARGHPMPMFRGAPAQAMLAFLPPARLRKICERHMDDPDLKRLGADWPAQKAHFSGVRKRGYYLSEQELEVGTMGLAVPILMSPVGLVGSIALVFDVERLALINVDGCAALAQRQAIEIAQRLAELAAGTRIEDPCMSAPIQS
jgi:DNA-binding IclR family transcriptional regulator